MFLYRLLNNTAVCKISRFYSSRTMQTSKFNDKPILYGDLTSPPVRSVVMTASILDIELDFRKIDLFTRENRSECYKKINPLQKVPAMVVGNTTICDSHAICLYLCHQSDDKTLYPNDLLVRSKVDEMLFFNSSTLFGIDSEMFACYFAGQWPLTEDMKEKWYSALDYLEYRLNSAPWLAGNKFHLCDICAAPVVSSSELLLPLTNRHSKVKKWIKNMEELPFYEISKEGLATLNSYINMMKK